MGTSTDGQICYGVHVGEELPWNDGGDDDPCDVEEWWRKFWGFKHSFEMFTPEGDWIDGVEAPQEQRDAYFEEQRKWDKAHPIPFELVNACSEEP